MLPTTNPKLPKFLDKLMEDNPEMEAQRSKTAIAVGCYLNPTEQAEFEAAKVNKKPYTYYQD